MRGDGKRGLFLLLLIAMLDPVPLFAQENVTFDQASRQVIGDWLIECVDGLEPVPGTCQMYQRVLTQNPNTAAMVVAIVWSPPESAFRLQIVLPFGTDLRIQPVMSIDGEVVQAFAWSRCLLRGCMVETLLPWELALRLIQGEVAAVSIVQPEGAVIEIPLSLTGFRSGLDGIMPAGALPDRVTPSGD